MFTTSAKFLLRKKIHSDGSIGRFLCIKYNEPLTEIKISAKQYNAFKKIGCFEVSETDFRQAWNDRAKELGKAPPFPTN